VGKMKSFSQIKLDLFNKRKYSLTGDYINNINFDWANGITDDGQRTNLKPFLQMR